MRSFQCLLVLSFSASALMSQGCSSEGESCDGSLTCDVDCDGVVDDSCEVRVLVEAGAGGALRIDEGPLAGFSLDIPPGALAEDTEISLLVTPGEVLQTTPWDASADALLYSDAWDSFEEIIEDWDELQSWGPAFLMEWISHEGLGDSEHTFDLQPSGLQFSSPARLTLPYSASTEGAKELWPALRIAQWSESEPTGRILSNTEIDPEAFTIAADISHFSKHQTKTGFSDSLYEVGVRLGLGASLIGLPFLLPLDEAKSLASPLSFTEISDRSADLAAEMFCAFEGESIDYSVPTGFDWAELMAHLSTMPSLFTPNADPPRSFATGNENALAANIREEKGPVSFAKEFQLSMELNGLRVFDSLMTMHNLGQGGHNLSSHLESMAYLHPSITDLRGAHYHMAGLALLHMYNGGDYQSVLFGYFDEVGISGALRGAFEVGELTANLIGSQLPKYYSSWSSACDPLSGQSYYCNEDNQLDGTDLGENDEIIVYGTCNGFDREWHITEDVDEAGVGTMPMVPDSCTALQLAAVIDTGDGLEWSYGDWVSASPSSSSTDLGSLEIQGMWSAIEGFVVDDQIPPLPVEGAVVTHLGDIALAQADSTFTLPERWQTCEPLVIEAEIDGFIGSSEPTDPTMGVTEVGFIIINEHIIVSNQSGDETSEDGQTVVTFDVTLAEDPGAETVTIDVAVIDPVTESELDPEATATPTPLTFTQADWDVPQTVTVVGIDDNTIDGDVDFDTVLSIASGPWTSTRRVHLVNIEGPPSAYFMRLRYLGDKGSTSSYSYEVLERSNAEIAIDRVGSYTGAECVDDYNRNLGVAKTVQTARAYTFTASGTARKTGLPLDFLHWNSVESTTESVGTSYTWRYKSSDSHAGSYQPECPDLPDPVYATAYTKTMFVTGEVPGIGELTLMDQVHNTPPLPGKHLTATVLDSVRFTTEAEYELTWTEYTVDTTTDGTQSRWLSETIVETYIEGIMTESIVTPAPEGSYQPTTQNGYPQPASLGSVDSTMVLEQDSIYGRHATYPLVW